MTSRYLISPETHSDIYAELFGSSRAHPLSSFTTPSLSNRAVHARKRTNPITQSSPNSSTEENALFTPDVARWQSSRSAVSRSSSHSPDSNVGHNNNPDDSLIFPSYIHNIPTAASKRRASARPVIPLNRSRAHHELQQHAPKLSHFGSSSLLLAPHSSIPFKDHLKRQGLHLFKPNLYLPATLPGRSSVSLITFPHDPSRENQEDTSATGKNSSASSESHKSGEIQGRYPVRARALASVAVAHKPSSTPDVETDQTVTARKVVSTVSTNKPKGKGKARQQPKQHHAHSTTPMTQPEDETATMPPPSTLPAKRKRVRVHLEIEDDDAVSVTGSEAAGADDGSDPAGGGRTLAPRAAKRRKVVTSAYMPPPPDPPSTKAQKESSADAMVLDEPVMMTRTRSRRRGGATSGSPPQTTKEKDEVAIKVSEIEQEDKNTIDSGPQPGGKTRSTRSRGQANQPSQLSEVTVASPVEDSVGTRHSPGPSRPARSKSTGSKSPTASSFQAASSSTMASPAAQAASTAAAAATASHGYGTRRAAASQTMSRQTTGASGAGTVSPSLTMSRNSSSVATRSSPPQLSFVSTDDILAEEHAQAESLKAKLPRMQRMNDATSVAVA